METVVQVARVDPEVMARRTAVVAQVVMAVTHYQGAMNRGAKEGLAVTAVHAVGMEEMEAMEVTATARGAVVMVETAVMGPAAIDRVAEMEEMEAMVEMGVERHAEVVTGAVEVKEAITAAARVVTGAVGGMVDTTLAQAPAGTVEMEETVETREVVRTKTADGEAMAAEAAIRLPRSGMVVAEVVEGMAETESTVAMAAGAGAVDQRAVVVA